MTDGRQYTECKRCVLDTSVADITFDSSGTCNYCSRFSERIQHVLIQDGTQRALALERLVATIKRAGQNRRYDCIIGVSGGVDSSWVLVNAVRLGLRPLPVHMDNGWNSELAQHNIARLVQSLGLDLHTHVIEWDEYRGLMQAFLDADVVDVELLYDNAMLAVNYQAARKFRLRYILAGDNMTTEGMDMPRGWNWLKFDKRNIQALAKRNGVRLVSFPSIGTIGYFAHHFIRGIKWVHFLDLLEYNKSLAISNLEQLHGFKRYPYKHYESIFTRFYQGYILPRKFGIDKRRLHLSALIVTNQMTRTEALALLQNIPYPSEREMHEDVEYFLKKMRWTSKQLEEYIARPGKSHMLYGSEKPLWDMAKVTHRILTRWFTQSESLSGQRC